MKPSEFYNESEKRDFDFSADPRKQDEDIDNLIHSPREMIAFARKYATMLANGKDKRIEVEIDGDFIIKLSPQEACAFGVKQGVNAFSKMLFVVANQD